MMEISIKNIGPITDTGTLEVARFNVIIGKQSTGKSTFMKILCFCQWLEKKIMTGDDKVLVQNYTHYSRFLKELRQFHRFNENFFTANSEIHYKGVCIAIDLVGNKNTRITRLPDFESIRHNTKLSFIPSERNLVSAIKNVDRAYKSNDNDVLFNHINEWSEAKEHASLKNPVDLSVVGDMEYYYDASSDSDTIQLRDKRKKVTPFYASSGVQSVLPIVVMTKYFTETIFSKTVDISSRDISEILRRIRSVSSEDSDINNELEKVSKIYNYQNTSLFVEEPEQNLFPESQQELMQYIVQQINKAKRKTGTSSSVMVTTHSPYVITALNFMLKASEAAKINATDSKKIIDDDCCISVDDIRAYYVTEEGKFIPILDAEAQMIRGTELDHASDIVEDKLIALNDIIYG